MEVLHFCIPVTQARFTLGASYRFTQGASYRFTLGASYRFTQGASYRSTQGVLHLCQQQVTRHWVQDTVDRGGVSSTSNVIQDNTIK